MTVLYITPLGLIHVITESLYLLTTFTHFASLGKTLMLGKAEGKRRGDNRGWDGWMASQTSWAWVWGSSGSWYWTEKPGVVQSMGSQRVAHNWATELNWTELNSFCLSPKAPFLKLKTSGRKGKAWRDPRLRIWLSCNPTSIWDSNGLIYPFWLEDAYREMRCLSA